MIPEFKLRKMDKRGAMVEDLIDLIFLIVGGLAGLFFVYLVLAESTKESNHQSELLVQQVEAKRLLLDYLSSPVIVDGAETDFLTLIALAENDETLRKLLKEQTTIYLQPPRNQLSPGIKYPKLNYIYYGDNDLNDGLLSEIRFKNKEGQEIAILALGSEPTSIYTIKPGD
jgi:hypothetical protein